MTLSMVLEDVKSDSGLINDPTAAARNRLNIENMRAKEKAHHAEGGLRTEPLLPRPQQKVITQQVKEIKQEEVTKVGNPVINSMDELEKQKDAIIADYMNPEITLAQMLTKYHIQSVRWHDLRIKWNVPSKCKRKLKPVKSTSTPPAILSNPSLPPFNEAWGDEVKVAWLHAWECK